VSGIGLGTNGGREQVLVLHPFAKSAQKGLRTPDARLAEAVSLVRAIDLEVAGAELIPVIRPRPATYLGRGAVEAIGARVAAKKVGLTFVDCALTPVQQRNLEREWKCKVVDRTGLILEIFGERARTAEGRLQVELAQLSYQRSRLVRSWTHLERQRGGLGTVGGPGETQIESDRRQISERIVRARRELEEVKRTRELHRKARRKVPHAVVALVGYTNAGKSTLFNRLTGAGVFVKDLLFATLDPTMRQIALPSGRTAILSDTVGFVSDLPTDLVAAFRATLEEVVDADLLIHVRDISHPDAEAQKADVIGVLTDLGIDPDGGKVVIEVLNKIDRLPASERSITVERALRRNDVVAVSAVTGEGCDDLLRVVDDNLNGDRRIVQFAIDLTDGAAIAWLYRHGQVFERRDDDSHAHIRVGLGAADLARFERRRLHS
jgi:GTP-binding protein HflX